MQWNRFTEEQIVKALKQYEPGMKVADICRECGIAAQTFWRRQSKPGDRDISEIKRFRALGEENARPAKMLAQRIGISCIATMKNFLWAMVSRSFHCQVIWKNVNLTDQSITV
jgi:putative transposase